MSDAEPPEVPPSDPQTAPSTQPNPQRRLVPKRDGKGFKKRPRANVGFATKVNPLVSVANDAGVSKEEAEAILEAFFDLALFAAKSGDKIAWPGFGSFTVVQEAATTTRNPQTGQTIKVPARKVLKFTASSKLHVRLNGPAKMKRPDARGKRVTRRF